MMAELLKRLGFVAGIVLLCFAGCTGGDSNVAAVTGTVKIDGQPIENAIVTFYPTQGRASGGITDANGVYELAYVGKQKGALIGEHRVTIKTEVRASAEYDGVAVEARKELLPKTYQNAKKTELTGTVKKGSNVIDFEVPTK